MSELEHSEKPLFPTPPTQESSDNTNDYPPSLAPRDGARLGSGERSVADPERRGSDVTSPPPIAGAVPPSRSYHALSWNVVTFLAFPAVLGVLARLGLHSLATYNGSGVFALAWVQGIGCFIMGLAVGKREAITD